MKKILVATDFSEAARNALDYAALMAKSFDGSIVLLHSFLLPVPVGDMPGYIPVSFAEVQEENEALIQRELEYLSAKHSVPADGYVRTGTASGEINNVANDIDADLVIMGMKGAGKTGGIFGSTVIAAIRSSKRPLLIIPETAHYSPVKNICFAADFGKWPASDDSRILVDFVNHYKAILKILHVQKDAVLMNTDEVSGKIRASLIFEKLNHSFHTIINETVESGLDEFIAENPVDMLVMVSHHHNLFERLFGKVHTKLMAYQTRLPLLVLHD